MKSDYNQSVHDRALSLIYCNLKFEARKVDAINGVSKPYTKMGLQLLQNTVAP